MGVGEGGVCTCGRKGAGEGGVCTCGREGICDILLP